MAGFITAGRVYPTCDTSLNLRNSGRPELRVPSTSCDFEVSHLSCPAHAGHPVITARSVSTGSPPEFIIGRRFAPTRWRGTTTCNVDEDVDARAKRGHDAEAFATRLNSTPGSSPAITGRYMTRETQRARPDVSKPRPSVQFPVLSA
jgi:hypothetical protein